MAIRIDDITSAEWSSKVGSPGEVVADVADIDQCIGIIVTTRPGSDPHRPLFGCDAWRYLDAPAAVAIPNIVREVVDALEMWEPRIDLVRVVPLVSGAQVTVSIEWKLKVDEKAASTSEVILVQSA